MLLGGVILPEGQHISIDFVRDALHGKPRKILEIANALLTLVFAVVVGWGGVMYVMHLYNVNAKFTRSIPIPRWIVELCVPIGMTIFAVAALYCLFVAATSKWEKADKPKPEDTGAESPAKLEDGGPTS